MEDIKASVILIMAYETPLNYIWVFQMSYYPISFEAALRFTGTPAP